MRPSTGMNQDEVRRIAHDPATFEQFYRENAEAIQRFLARRVGDPDLVADLMADVFLAAVDSAEAYSRERGTPKAWLFGIASIVVASELRRSMRRQRVVRRVEGRALLDSNDVARIHDRIDAAAQARRLYGVLGRLPESERTLFELVALDELSTADAAAALGIRPATARVRLHRARRTLRGQLAAQESTTLVQPMEASP
jgi:RNA polymerase sigma factor (sigma-70 family)